MSDLVQFKKEIYLYALLCAIFFEIVSIPVFGLGIEFAYGICLGTVTAIVNFSIMSIAFSKMFDAGKVSISVAGYILRLALCAGVFVVALQVGKVSAFGVLCGLFTIKISIYFLHVMKKRI